MAKATLKPDSVSEVKQFTNTGLQGKHFNAVTRKGKKYSVNHKDQDDEKYYHLWHNLSNLKYGKVAQCGHTNGNTCTTKTVKGIKGYRNICPIGGVTGTYVQPSPIYLKFNPKNYGIDDDTKITKFTLSFKHRCMSANVANNTEYQGTAPNFSGFNHYPSHKVLTVSFNGTDKTYNTNPPLSKNKYDTVSFTFTFKNGITGKTLKNNAIAVKYGNNFEADAGILYVDDFNLSVEYVGKELFFEGTQNNSTIYTAEDTDCASEITYTLKAGYKEGNKIVAPYNQQNNITYSAPPGVTVTLEKQTDNITVLAKIKDKSLTPGTKQIYFTLTSNKKQIGFSFQTILRPKPKIQLTPQIEKNVVINSTPIIVNGGCTKKITAYFEKVGGESFVFDALQESSTNMIPQNKIEEFYTWLQNKPCGEHKIYFQRGNETSDKMILDGIRIIPTTYNVEAYYENKKVSSSIEGIEQDKESNKELQLKFIKGNKELINNPKFLIVNPTYGLIQETPSGDRIPTRFRISEEGISWHPDKNGGSTNIDIGTYYPGEYSIEILEPNNCNKTNMKIDVKITPDHKQSFDTIFVRGEDSTAFDYDYLVALEGDTIQEPVFPTKTLLGASYKDISICVDKEMYIARIGDTETIRLLITNNSAQDIKNLYLEPNLLKMNDNKEYYVSTDEWVENGGIFSTLQNDFDNYNEDISSILELINLSEDKDDIEEENIYINIKQLKAGQTIPIYLPFGSYMEKDSYLQILLFEEPMELNLCNNQNKIDKINLKVFDSILTEMSISKDIDLLFPDKNCPFECFYTNEGVRYSVKNIDSSDVEGQALFEINNDARLKPYKVVYNGVTTNIDENNNFVETENTIPIRIINETVNKNQNCRGIKVKCSVNYGDLYPKESLTSYTDVYSIATFFVKIPTSIGRDFDIKTLIQDKICTFTCEDNISILTDNSILYKPGQIVPIKVKATKSITFIENKIIFNANIKKSGKKDFIDIYYKICNLQNNEGELQTIFKTKDDNGEYNLVPNQVSETILCGIQTDITPSVSLKKIVIENRHINRLYISLNNKKRFNKNVSVVVTERNDDEINKYKYLSHNTDIGIITVEDDKITWNIDYLLKNSIVTGYIDFEATHIGLSNLKVEVNDFMSDIDKSRFGIQCDCRKEV